MAASKKFVPFKKAAGKPAGKKAVPAKGAAAKKVASKSAKKC